MLYSVKEVKFNAGDVVVITEGALQGEICTVSYYSELEGMYVVIRPNGSKTFIFEEDLALAQVSAKDTLDSVKDKQEAPKEVLNKKYGKALLKNTESKNPESKVAHEILEVIERHCKEAIEEGNADKVYALLESYSNVIKMYKGVLSREELNRLEDKRYAMDDIAFNLQWREEI